MKYYKNHSLKISNKIILNLNNKNLQYNLKHINMLEHSIKIFKLKKFNQNKINLIYKYQKDKLNQNHKLYFLTNQAFKQFL